MSIVAQPRIATPAQTLQTIENELNGALIERTDTIRLALIATVSQQHMVILGPPGTAKSNLINDIAEHVATPSGGGLRRFVWLMTKSTTPDDLFGPVSVAAFKQDRYERITANKLPEAQLVFLDEIFKSNSAILNALLTITNERAFDNGPTRQPVPLISMFGASNELPQGDDLGALWDRFLVRDIVSYVSDGGFAKLVRLARATVQRTAISEADLLQAQRDAAAVQVPDDVLTGIEQLRRDLGSQGIVPSDRRWLLSFDALRANAYLDGRAVVDEDDLSVLASVLWQTPDQRAAIRTTAAKIANPLNARAVELGDQAHSVYDTFLQISKDPNATEDQKSQKAVEAVGKMKRIKADLTKVKKEAGVGRVGSRVDKVLADLNTWQTELLELATGA